MTRTTVEEFDGKGRLVRRTVTERDEMPLTLPYAVPCTPWPIPLYEPPAYPIPNITFGSITACAPEHALRQ